MPIKSFRGLLANAGQERLSLHTNDGRIGYRIVKFQVMTKEPGNTSQDLVVKIYKIEQSSVPSSSATIDFSDNTLIGAGWFSQATADFSHYQTVVFDNEIFNQDIYVTNTDNDGSDACNYYIELEQIKLNLDESTVATLKNIRNST